MNRSRDFFLLLIVILYLETATTLAADIATPEQGRCTILVSGPIETGDAKRLETLLTASQTIPTASQTRPLIVCLESDGGSYSEALLMVEAIWSLDSGDSVYTAVRKNGTCLSACAIVFLAGFSNEGDDIRIPYRFIHPSAKLGFHAPYIQAKEDSIAATTASRAYRAGTVAIAKLLKLSSYDQQYERFFPRDLLAEALEVPPNQFLYIDTIDDLGRWEIFPEISAPPTVVTRGALEQACINQEAWNTNFGGQSYGPMSLNKSARSQKVVFKNNYYREKFSGFGEEAVYECFVQLFKKENGDIVLSLQLLASDETQADWDDATSFDEFRKSAQDFGEHFVSDGLGHIYDGLYYLYDPEEKISVLVRPKVHY